MALLLAALSPSPPAIAEDGLAADLVGELTLYIADGRHTLLDVARDHDLGVLEIMAANPGIDPWIPGEATSVLLPTAHILPDAPRKGIVINLAELHLYRFAPGNGPVTVSAIGIGREGFTTPLGRTRVVRKQVGPAWYPTAGTRADDPSLPAVVPPGPDNPLGDYALYLGWEGYLIHGTSKPYGVGRRVSRGCIRLYPESIERLFRETATGTPVTVVDQQVKLGWRSGQLYIEVHPTLEELDELERTGRLEAKQDFMVDQEIVAKAGAAAIRLNWKAIHVALRQRLGIPVRITRDLDLSIEDALGRRQR